MEYTEAMSAAVASMAAALPGGHVMTTAILRQPISFIDATGFRGKPVTAIFLTESEKDVKHMLAIYEIGLEAANKNPNLLGDKLNHRS